MSEYKNKKEWEKWSEMVKDSKDADDRFYNMPDDDAILQADKKIKSLYSKNYNLEQENAELEKKLKVAEEGLTVAYMHGVEKGKDKYKKALEEIYNEGSGNTRHLMTLMAGEALGE